MSNDIIYTKNGYEVFRSKSCAAMDTGYAVEDSDGMIVQWFSDGDDRPAALLDAIKWVRST